MESWKKHMMAGNHQFDQGNWSSAIVHYLSARAKAERLFSDWGDSQEAVSALLASYHNLAEAYRRLGKQEKTMTMLEKVYDIFCETLNSSEISYQKRAAILRGLRSAYMAILSEVKILEKTSDQKITARADIMSNL